MRERKVNKIKEREKIKEISNVRQRFIVQEMKEKDKGLNYFYFFVFVRVIYLYLIRDLYLVKLMIIAKSPRDTRLNPSLESVKYHAYIFNTLIAKSGILCA